MDEVLGALKHRRLDLDQVGLYHLRGLARAPAPTLQIVDLDRRRWAGSLYLSFSQLSAGLHRQAPGSRHTPRSSRAGVNVSNSLEPGPNRRRPELCRAGAQLRSSLGVLLLRCLGRAFERAGP